jgi:hypothetical protein
MIMYLRGSTGLLNRYSDELPAGRPGVLFSVEWRPALGLIRHPILWVAGRSPTFHSASYPMGSGEKSGIVVSNPTQGMDV